LRMLIADDDDYTREGLVDSINWEQYGIKHILQARDGMEALRMASIQRPDIVLTDIRMPKLNGIEFAERLAELCPDSQLLFMSGYMDVDYLRSAIKLDAVDYIEKPIRLEAVHLAFVKTLERLRQRRSNEAIRDAKLYLERQRLASLVIKEGADMELVARLCEETGFPAEGQYTVIAMMRRDGQRGEINGDELGAALGYWEEQGQAVAANAAEYGMYVIVGNTNHSRKRIQSSLELFAREYSAYTLGIGEEVAALQAVPRSCESAQRAAALAFYEPERRCFRYEECLPPRRERYASLLPEFYERLQSDPGGLKGWLDRLCDAFAERRSPEKERIVSLLSVMADSLLEGQPELKTRQEIGDPAAELAGCANIGEVRSYMRRLADVYEDAQRQASGYSRLVQDVIRYIARHYGRADLDMPEIAGHFHLSAAHLGVLFKQETGSSVKQYIGDYRIGMSKKLITTGHFKINEIAEKCGYASASYFAKAFKAATDLSPVEYKRQSER
jgi:two-component system response regulator YesN